MKNNLALGKRFEFNNEFFDKPLQLGFVHIYQIGELSCEAGYHIKPHKQLAHEISYIVSGEGTFITDGIKTDVGENDVYINSVGQIHSICADKHSHLRFFYLAFNFDKGIMQGKFDDLNTFYENVPKTLINDQRELAAPFNNIFHELYNKDEYSLEMLESYIRQIIIIIYRSYKESSKPVVMPLYNDNTIGHAVYSVIRYIDEKFWDITESRLISSDLGYSYTYLAHIFKKKMGMTITSYIIQKKMDKAKELLESGRFNITQIAMRLNYMSVQSFSSSFKRFIGVSPVEYMKTYQKTNIKNK